MRNKELKMIKQLEKETTKCDKCNKKMETFKLTVKKGYSLVCSTCQIKTIKNKLRKEGMWL